MSQSPVGIIRLCSWMLAIFLCSLHPPLIAQDYKVKSYDINSGLPDAYVYTMHQDVSGYLWIGTGNGLARFNGKAFTVFSTDDSLCSNFITCSNIHGRDSWFGHNNGGISHYDGNDFTKIVPGEQGTGSITDIKFHGNTTWASTQSGGIWRIEAGHQPRLFSDPEHPVAVFTFELLSSTECAVGSMDGVYIFAIDNESTSFRLITTLEGLPDTKIQDLLLSGNKGTLFILTQDEGIFTYNTKQFTPQTDSLALNREGYIESPQQIFEDGQNNLWITTFGEGLFKFSPDGDGEYTTWINYKEENGLTGNNVKTLIQDREENIWLGMFGTGVARMVDEAYTFYSFDEKEADNNIYSIFATDDLLWFGSETGLITFQRETHQISFISGGTNGLPIDRVTAIAGSSTGDLWVGTNRTGVFHLQPEGNTFARVPISPGTLENSINAMAFKEPFLWVATDKGVCKIDAGSESITWFTIRNAGLPHNTVNYLQVDESGKVWLSTLSNTISYIENDSVTRLIIPTVGGALDIRSITKDPDGTIWVGTNGNGVFKMDGDSATNFTTFNGLLSDYCYSLVGDDARYIWVSHKGGLSRISLSDGFISNVKDEAGIDRAMEFNQNAVFKDQKGMIWFGSTSGVLEYNTTREKNQSPPPALSITSVLAEKQLLEVKDELQLPPGRYDLRINFVGVNLKNPEAVVYSYKMEGLGNAWSEDFTDNQVTFNKVPDGKYVFNLKATNGEGVSTEDPVALFITISRPLWKRWWFYAIILSMVTSVIVMYIKRREHNLLIEKQQLEKAVKERTLEVVEQKEEIERQRDAIKIQSDEIVLINKNITDSITYARRIQQAVFPPTEHLASFFPESFILNRPQYIVSGDFFWVAKKNGKQIVTVADCTGHGVPGAFMSMLGITMLNEIVNNQNCVEADQILNKLKNEIILALRQKGTSESTSDGMDMALCVYDPSTLKLQYAGGFNPLVMIRNGELIRYRADPMPIGIGAISGKDFTKHELGIEKDDQIYLYSDGYEDQFGGEKDKKFSRRRFRELLMDIQSLSMNEQKAELEKRLDGWMDGREQIDDITVMGIRF